jgi:hypothetical protein
MRKEQKLDFETTIEVEYSGHPDLEKAISSHMVHITHETHAARMVRSAELSGATKWVINKMPLELTVRKS